MKRKIILLIIIIICIIGLTFSITNIIKWKDDSNKTKIQIEKIKEIIEVKEIKDTEKVEIIEQKEGEKNMEHELSLEHFLVIDKSIGMGFCMDDEDFYKEILSTFVSQATNFISQLEQYYNATDWGNYAIIAHSLKSNTRTIGAENFAELSLKHELAGKSGDGAFITEDVTVLKALMEKVQGML